MSNFPLRKIKSFVRRDSRLTQAQLRALRDLLPRYELKLEQGWLDFSAVFQQKFPSVFEIGFGSGASLLEAAKRNPQQNFIGVEMHQPGIGNLLLGMEAEQIENIRIFYADAVEVLKQSIPDKNLDVVQIFFPDPWPKRRHHKRRLIQPEFVNLVAQKLKNNGAFHLATDWQDYAIHMLKVLSETSQFTNKAGPGNFSNRSCQRPVVTKFENRGKTKGHEIFELQFFSGHLEIP